MNSSVAVVVLAAMLGGGERLMSREDPRVGRLAREALEAGGVRVLTGRQVCRARSEKNAAVLELDNGGSVSADVVVLGTGRRPHTSGFGLETLGIRTDGLPEQLARPWLYETEPTEGYLAALEQLGA